MKTAKFVRQQTLALEPESKINQDSYELMQMMNTLNKRKEDLDIIYNKLQRLPFFNQFVDRFFKARNRENLLLFCSTLQIEHFFAGDIIFEEGDISNDKLYIIYTGSVLLFRRKPVEQLQKDLKEDIEKRKRIQIIEEDNTPNSALCQTPLSIKYIVKMKFLANKLVRKTRKALSGDEKLNLEHNYGPVLRTMLRGEGFGEKAILENTTRTLTIAANSGHVFLVVLKKEHFAELQSQFEQEMKEKKKIIFTVFSNIKDEYSSARLETIFYSFESKEYDRNSILYSEEEPGDVFFIIQRGEVTLSKQFLDESKTPPSESVIYICTLGISYNSELPFKGVGHLLGEEILTNKKGVYENTAVVTSQNTTLMVVSYNEFHNKFPEECREQILSGYKKKSANRQSMFQRMCDNRTKSKTVQSEQVQSFDQILQLSNLSRVMINKSFKFQRLKTEQASKLSQFYSCKDLIPNQLKISHDLEEQFWNPTLTQYCINTIVQNQGDNHEKTKHSTHQLVGSSSAIAEMYDFGKERPDERKKKQHLFDVKMNVRVLAENFIKQNENTLPSKIQKEYNRILRKKKNLSRIDPVFKSSFIINSVHDNSSQALLSNKSQTFNKSTIKLFKDSFQSARMDTIQTTQKELFIGNRPKIDTFDSSRGQKKTFKNFQINVSHVK